MWSRRSSSDALNGWKASRILIELLKAYSPSGRESEAVEVAGKWARELGYDDVWVDDSGSLHAEVGKGHIKVLLAGHIDTVPGYLDVKVNGEFVSGRGAVDAKGPLTSLLLAGPLIEGCRVRFSALTGEEDDSRGALALISRGEKFDHAIVGEPTGLKIAIGYRGSMKLKAVCKGEGGHSSSPEVGDSAFDKLMELLSSLKSSSPDAVASIVNAVVASPADNMLPVEAEALIDVRFFEKPSLTLPRRCGIKIRSYTRPVKVKPQTPVVRALQRSLLSEGLKPIIAVKRGTSDMNLLYESVSTSIAAFVPGDPRLSHTRSEVIRISEIIVAARVVAGALRYLCGSSASGGRHGGVW